MYTLFSNVNMSSLLRSIKVNSVIIYIISKYFDVLMVSHIRAKDITHLIYQSMDNQLY